MMDFYRRHLNIAKNLDPLTRINNRKSFEKKINKSIAQTMSDVESVFILIDIDNFSGINYSYGHACGDGVILAVSESIKSTVLCSRVNYRKHFLGRLGGDEFGLFLENISKKDAAKLARSLSKNISKIEYVHKGQIVNIKASIGCAVYPVQGFSFSNLLANSTIAMKCSKKITSRRVTFFDSEDFDFDNIKKELYWDNFSKKTISNDLLKIYFQPIAKIPNGDEPLEINHYECLLRVKDFGKWVSPSDYVLAAERIGSITDLDFYIIGQVFNYVSILEDRGLLNDLKFSINISGASFMHPHFKDYIIFKKNEMKINPKNIIFEITETAIIQNFEQSILNIKDINKIGFSFALDDFGVGFSNFTTLKDADIEYVKIDGSFVKNMMNNTKDQIIVNSIYQISRAFGQKTIAEYVENESILIELGRIGIDYAQGYHIAKPQSFEYYFNGD